VVNNPSTDEARDAPPGAQNRVYKHCAMKMELIEWNRWPGDSQVVCRLIVAWWRKGRSAEVLRTGEE
jgi:hypothetical protein